MSSILIPDIHEDYLWLERIIAANPDADRYILMGDIMDSKNPKISDARKTGELILEHKSHFGDKYTILFGNHEAQYWETFHRVQNFSGIDRMKIRTAVGSFRTNKAKKWGKLFNKQDFLDMKPFINLHGHIISHAGIKKRFFKAAEYNLETLENTAIQAWENIHHEMHPLLAPGKARNGDQKYGGITFLSWENFKDNLPFPQIMGHSPHIEPQQKGRSWNIDCGQTFYGILNENSFETHNI
jgi:hypothetical protein